MIENDKFYCCHIGKTGGDAIKQICEQLELPLMEVMSTSAADPSKHATVFRENKDFVMSIRRLPSHAISCYFHHLNHHRRNVIAGSQPVPPFNHNLTGRDLGEWIIENRQLHHAAGGKAAQKHTRNGTILPKYFIRSEHLRNDLETLLQRYYKLSQDQCDIIQNGVTKTPMKYDHDITKYFSEEQIKRLYEKDPLWAQLESKAYPPS